MSNEIYGIDLGTTYSAIARVDEYHKPVVVPTLDSENTTPSVVLFEGENESVVGVSAKAEALIQPENVVQLVKRHMGEPDWSHESHGKSWTAAEVSSLILRKLAADAERVSGEPVSRVIITVPAYFGDEERSATRRAGQIAGLEVVDILNEPTAAAYSFGLGEMSAGSGNVLVYDLGGGTFDVTVIHIDEKSLTTIATAGNHHLGGADIDRDLAEELAHRITEETGDSSNPMDDAEQAQYLLSRAEAAKRALSEKMSTPVFYVHQGKPGKLTLTQDELNELASNVVDQTLELTEAVLGAAKEKGIASIDRLLLVGGQSKMPLIAQRLRERFNLEGELRDPDLAVVRGAAWYGYKVAIEDAVKRDLVDSGAIKPGQSIRDASSEAIDAVVANLGGNTTMSPTEVRRLAEIEVTNVLSRGLGVLVVRDPAKPDDLRALFLAHQNEPLPMTRESELATLFDDQSQVDFEVCQQGGNEESDAVEDNEILGVGSIRDIPRGYRAGTPIKVLLNILQSGELNLRFQHPGASEPLELTLHTTGAGRDASSTRESRRKISGVAVQE